VKVFQDSFDQLYQAIDEKQAKVLQASRIGQTSVLPEEYSKAIQQTVEAFDKDNAVKRMRDKDASYWKSDADARKIIDNALGWLTVTDAMEEQLGDLRAFAAEVRDEGVTDVVLLGMGGSSLAPEVIKRSFGTIDGWPTLHVLDTTDAGAIRAVEAQIDLEHALFLVSTKSGGTIETLSLFRHFWERRSDGRAFVAITDPGSGVQQLAHDHEFRRTFLNDPEIGGRYSALSLFGLVPAALMGVDVTRLLQRAIEMAEACHLSEGNPGLELGTSLGEGWRDGRDKNKMKKQEQEKQKQNCQ